MEFDILEIKKFIIEHYGLQANKLDRIKNGLMNFNYLVTVDSENYIFRINYLRSVPEVTFTVEILQQLAKVDFPSPRLVAGNNHKIIQLIKDKPCVLYEYIPGDIMTSFNENLLAQVGSLLAKKHQILRNFQPSVTKPTWDPVELLEIVKNNRENMIKSNFIGATELMNFMETELIKFNFPANLPKGITHQDVKPENIIVQDNNIQGIVDFDNAYHGVLLHDITTPVIWTCFENDQLNYQLLSSYLKGYNKKRLLTLAERDYLLPAIKFRLAREAFIGPFAIYPYPEKSQERSDHFKNLYKKTEALEGKDFMHSLSRTTT